MGIEPVLAHIDSCGTITSLLFGRFLALHAGRAPFHLLRTRAEGRTDQAPPRSQDQGALTVPPIRVGSAGRRTRRASQHALSRRFQHARCRAERERGETEGVGRCQVLHAPTASRYAREAPPPLRFATREREGKNADEEERTIHCATKTATRIRAEGFP